MSNSSDFVYVTRCDRLFDDQFFLTSPGLANSMTNGKTDTSTI